MSEATPVFLKSVLLRTVLATHTPAGDHRRHETRNPDTETTGPADGTSCWGVSGSRVRVRRPESLPEETRLLVVLC